MDRSRALVFLAILSATHAPASAQIYKWMDETGATHYGSVPPAGAKGTLVQPAAPVGSAAASSPVEPARKPLGETQRAAEVSPAAQAREPPGLAERQKAEAERLRRCALARQQLDVVTQGGPVFRRDGKGGRYYLPDEARSGEIARLRAEVAQQCAGLDSNAATQARWREIDYFVACDRARSLLRAFDANRSRISNQEYEGVTRQVEESCAPNRFPPETGRRGEWFRQYVLPGELRQ